MELTLQEGINDFLRPYYDEDFKKMSTQEIIDGLTQFISKIKNDNNGELIVLSLLPIRQVHPWSNHYAIISKEIPLVNKGLSEFCKANNIRYIDSYSHFADECGIMREDLSDDGLHPNNEFGYPILTELINTELEKIPNHQL